MAGPARRYSLAFPARISITHGHMANISEPLSSALIGTAPIPGDLSVRIRRGAEYVAIPMFALAVSSVLFSIFLAALGKSPIEFFELVHRGGFGTAFSIQNTLQRSAPLILPRSRWRCRRASG